jgi:AraC-like DNA-binding protein
MTVVASAPNRHAAIEVLRPGTQPIVELRYGAAVKVDAGQFPRLLLMQTCVQGSGKATQAGVSASWQRGRTLPLSPDLSTQLEFDARYAQRSIKLDIARLEALCARLVNHGLDRPLRFELRPFSEELEKMWSQALDLLLVFEKDGSHGMVGASGGLDEFLLTLLLTKHPHNYSGDLQKGARPPAPRLIRDAEYLMTQGDSAMTVGQIAAHLRVSLRTLEAGFREYKGITPLRRFREIRLQKVRDQLLSASNATSVTSVAMANGFYHLPRFSAYYRSAFGETPAATLRSARR